MLRNNRALYLHSAAIQDLSLAMSDLTRDTKVFDYTSPGDYLYLGSDLPFNHRYFDVKSPNAVAGLCSVDLWNGTAWVPAVDVMDDSSVGGVPFARAGIVSWQPDLTAQSWIFQDTNRMSGSGIESGPKIFGLYWARLSWSVTLTGTTELEYIGHRFCTTEQMEAKYPDFADSQMKDSWLAGKTDWNRECIMAAEEVIADLRGKKDLIQSASQILDPYQFQDAAVHKVADIIMRGLGKDYTELRMAALQDYSKALNVGRYNVDKNENATLDDEEKETNVRHGFR